MMHVQQAQHAFVQNPPDNFRHPVHPARIRLAGGVYVLDPGYRDANRAKSGVADSADQAGGYRRVPPCGFRFRRRYVFTGLRAAFHRIQAVSQVPSGADRTEE